MDRRGWLHALKKKRKPIAPNIKIIKIIHLHLVVKCYGESDSAV